MANPLAVDVAHQFWSLMATNEFDRVSEVLANEFVFDLPQSNERIRGAELFAQFNREYPAHGPWQFTVHRIIGNDSDAVSDVTATDGVQTGRAITFFFVANGRITRIVEYWPEPFERPANRAYLSEILDDD